MKNNSPPYRVSIKSDVASGSLLEKFAVNVLGAVTLLADPGITVYQLYNGTVIEVHTKETFHPQDIFAKGNTILSFCVRDIEEAVKLMLAAGAHTIDGIVRISETYAYCHLILGDSQVVGIHQTDDK